MSQQGNESISVSGSPPIGRLRPDPQGRQKARETGASHAAEHVQHPEHGALHPPQDGTGAPQDLVCARRSEQQTRQDQEAGTTQRPSEGDGHTNLLCAHKGSESAVGRRDLTCAAWMRLLWGLPSRDMSTKTGSGLGSGSQGWGRHYGSVMGTGLLGTWARTREGCPPTALCMD